MDHCYAQVHECESNFRPARVFHSLCAVASYYSHLKQRTKALFQLSCLWAINLSARAHKQTNKQKQLKVSKQQTYTHYLMRKQNEMLIHATEALHCYECRLLIYFRHKK